jgi:hypothetical protein
MKTAPVVVAVVVSAVCSFGQPLSGTVEGFTFDRPTGSIRPILGRPGSAYLGPAEVAGLTFASVAPGQRHSLAVRDGKLILVSGLGHADRREAELPTLEGVPDGAAWSRDGRTAVLYSREEGWLQVVRGLPQEPVAGERLERGGIRQVVTDGESILALREGGLERMAFDGAALAAPVFDEPVAIAVGRERGLVYAANRAGEICEIDFDAQRIGRYAETAHPVRDLHLVEARDGRPLLAVLHADRLAVWDPQTWEAVQSSALDFAADSLLPLGATSIALGGRREDGEPLWVADSGEVLFVPAPKPEPASEVRHW